MNFFANPIAKNTATGRSCANLKVVWFFCYRDIQPRDIFMHFYLKKSLYFEVCKFEKKYFRFEFLFLRIPSPRIPRQVGRVQIWRSWYFLKRDIQPRGISSKVLHSYLRARKYLTSPDASKNIAATQWPAEELRNWQVPYCDTSGMGCHYSLTSDNWFLWRICVEHCDNTEKFQN